MPVIISPPNVIYFYLKKHYCPSCAGKMRPIWIHSVTYSNDPTADLSELKFVSEDGPSPNGDVYVHHWQEFKCKECGRQMSEKQLRDWEKHN